MNPLIVFIHLEKTGGTTFGKEILENNFNSIRYPRGVLPSGGWNSYNAIHGHFNMNCVENSGHFKGREKIYFTFLRDPVKRLLSYYYFADHMDSTEKWLTDHRQMLSNVMVSRLSNCTGGAKQYHLDKAKDTLDNINFGLTENFDTSLKLFQKKYPEFFKDISSERKNVTKKKYSFSMQSDRVKNLLINYNNLDSELYQYAKKLFKRRIENGKINKNDEA